MFRAIIPSKVQLLPWASARTTVARLLLTGEAGCALRTWKG